ncbi:MAG: efflux RND transporter periplasmic adaptor subunit [Acidobacteria bacterium]|nr:MAG: efflux RND transporter periplasmic adaptor subunit [Acidobacteriota bacterium]
MRNFILGFILALLLTGAGYWVVTTKPFGLGGAAKSETAQRYHCPMHPTYVSDKPGDCPICGMRLVPIKTDASGQPESGHADNPAGPESMTDEHAGHQAGATAPAQVPASPSVPGYSTVNLPADRQQLMGVTLVRAEAMPLEQSIRTFGRVTYDETKLHHVHTKFEGFIEDLYANFIGQFVKRGQPLFSVYSPELYATQKEYLLALRAEEQFGDLNEQKTGPKIDMVGAARQRLALWDVPETEIKRLEQTREPIRALTVNSPMTGFVTMKTAVEGLRVMPGDTLYDIVDLSSVWVLADVYEVNLPFVKMGQHAEMLLPYEPGKKFSGRVTYINPTLDEKTRTVKARIEFANPQGVLKPEMYGDVLIHGSRGSGVAVPENAVISTGERSIVFVAKGNGVFEPREVTVGVKVRNLYEIKNGVAAGEQVATGANFLLDSESKLKATLAGAGGGHKHGQ